LTAWRSLATAPRDRPIRLYLPGHTHKIGQDGRPTDISHAECVGHWDKASSHWVNEAGHNVYPSQWSPLDA
jgi:hypothetical protein